MEDWQRLWTLVPIPVRDIQALRAVLEEAASGASVSEQSIEGLSLSVRWVADDYSTVPCEVATNLAELAALIVAWDATRDHDAKAALMHSIADAILKHARLTRSSEPSRNSRCYCGSGKRYKDCHGAATA